MFPQALLGYRCWCPGYFLGDTAGENLLYPLGFAYRSLQKIIDKEPAGPFHPWSPGGNVARCWDGAGHRPPSGNCDCGLYAWHHPLTDADLSPEPEISLIGGAVVACGDIRVHQLGFRAQQAQILALMRPAHPGRVLSKIKAVADHYQVPLLDDEKALEEYALACGYRTVPTELLPDPEASTERTHRSPI